MATALAPVLGRRTTRPPQTSGPPPPSQQVLDPLMNPMSTIPMKGNPMTGYTAPPSAGYGAADIYRSAPRTGLQAGGVTSRGSGAAAPSWPGSGTVPAGTGYSGGAGSIDWASILNPGTSGHPTPVEFKGSAERNPDLDYVIGELRKRYEGDMGAGRAIDLAGGKIREAGIGARKGLEANLARRGVSGTGLSDNKYGQLARAEQRDIAGAAAGITSDAEGRREGVLGQIAGTGSALGSLQLGQLGLQANIWNTQQANARANEQAQLSRLMAILNMMNGMDDGPVAMY